MDTRLHAECEGGTQIGVKMLKACEDHEDAAGAALATQRSRHRRGHGVQVHLRGGAPAGRSALQRIPAVQRPHGVVLAGAALESRRHIFRALCDGAGDWKSERSCHHPGGGEDRENATSRWGRVLHVSASGGARAEGRNFVRLAFQGIAEGSQPKFRREVQI